MSRRKDKERRFRFVDYQTSRGNEEERKKGLDYNWNIVEGNLYTLFVMLNNSPSGKI